MTEKTLKKANEIKAEMDKLKKENEKIKRVVGITSELWFKRKLYSIKQKRLRKKLKE